MKLVYQLFGLLLVLVHVKSAISFDIKFDKAQREAVNSLANGNIESAYAYANKSVNATMTNDIIRFIVMDRSIAPSIEDAEYLAKKYSWLAAILPNRFDKVLNNSLSFKEIKEFLAILPKKTALSQIFLYDAAIREKTHPAEDLKKLERIWVKSTFQSETENYLINTYIKSFHISSLETKIRTFLMCKKIEEAKNLIRFLPAAKKSIYEELIKANSNMETAKKLFKNKQISPQLKAVALYFYIRHLNAAKKYQAGYDLLLQANYKEFPVRWWQLKNIAIRNALREKKYQTALKLAKSNQIKQGPDFFESEWLAGFITFRMLGNPRSALEHFHNIFNTAKTSHSKAQGAYWLGRAYKAIRDKQKMSHWLNFAARTYPHFFYGQLASLEVGSKLDYRTPINEKKRTPPKAINKKRIEEVIIWTKALYKCGLKAEANKLASYIMDFDLSDSDLAKVLEQLEEVPIIVAVAKQLANSGRPIIEASYPSHSDIHKIAKKYDHTLYLAIIRQESGFDHEALSPAGARGLMQLMPRTAENYAKKLKLEKNDYDCNASTNINIGACYVDRLMELWDNNYIMAIASYNAGENAVARWTSEYGDPRNLKKLHEVLDWLELMPYGETRLYVKKVLENIVNYNAAIAKKNYTKVEVLQLFSATAIN
ncbi:MAG: lytic transglycosylase domain-containing protein [Candidatus Midichloria sp.]|nr:lytic transglycosylase domain-containing protein [Candidatus Midichloria sp.]